VIRHHVDGIAHGNASVYLTRLLLDTPDQLHEQDGRFVSDFEEFPKRDQIPRQYDMLLDLVLDDVPVNEVELLT